MRNTIIIVALVILLLTSCSSARPSPTPTDSPTAITTATSLPTATPDTPKIETENSMPAEIVYAPIEAEAYVGGIGTVRYSIALDESIRNKEDGFKTVNINRNYKLHELTVGTYVFNGFTQEAFETIKGTENPEDSFAKALQVLMWINHITNTPSHRDITFEQFSRLPESERIIMIPVPATADGSWNTKPPSDWKKETFVPTKVNYVAVESIYGKSELKGSQSIIGGSYSVNGVHLELKDGEVTIYFIPDKMNFSDNMVIPEGETVESYKVKIKNKIFATSIMNASCLVLGEATLEDVKASGYYDWFRTVENGPDRPGSNMAMAQCASFLEQQGYTLPQESVLVVSDNDKLNIRSELGATPYFNVK